ncbi:hypothetical protein [Streptomyces luteireticuli]
MDAEAALTGGSWFSPYDNVQVQDASALDVDRVVPLAEDWDRGASHWSAKEREAYANDLGDERALIAVTAKSGRQKADVRTSPNGCPPPVKTVSYVVRRTSRL